MSEQQTDDRRPDIVTLVALAVAAIMAIGATQHHPYSFYQWTRWAETGASALAIWRLWHFGWWWAALAFCWLAVLFNPIAPFRMARYEWPLYDLVAAGLCVIGGLLIAWLAWRRPPAVAQR